MQLKRRVADTAEQLVACPTGDGVVNWIWHTYPPSRPTRRSGAGDEGGAPAARQHDFRRHQPAAVPVASLAMALLPFIAVVALRRQHFAAIGELAASVALAVLANAAVFGTLANRA